MISVVIDIAYQFISRPMLCCHGNLIVYAADTLLQKYFHPVMIPLYHLLWISTLSEIKYHLNDPEFF